MTSVNVTENKYSVSVTEGATTVVTAKAPGPQGIQGLGISAGDKGSLTVAANLIDWTLNDSVVTNAKVSASAAIAGTKISPDFGSQNITTTGNAVFGGNLTVSGTTTTIDSTTLTVEDKNIELGKVGSPTDITADGGGITLLGDTNHTFNWVNATDSWTSSEHIALPDNKKLQLGDSQDLQLYHDSNNSVIDSNTGNLYLQSANNLFIQGANNENIIKYIANGALQIYHDGTKKAETSANGFDLPDNSKLQLGDSQDLQIYHDSNNSVIDSNTGNLSILSASNLLIQVTSSNENAIKCLANGAVELYHDGTKKVDTTSSGINVEGTVTDDGATHDGDVTFTGDSANVVFDKSDNALEFANDAKAVFGANGEIEIFRSGSESLIVETQGNNLSLAGNRVNLLRADRNTVMLQAIANGPVELYHNNARKAETTSSGLTVTGTVTETSDIAYKSDIKPITNTLDKLQQITGYKYKLNNASIDSMGVIAQDVEKVFPELVHGDEGSKTLQYSGLIGVLVEAVKDLSAKVKKLESN